jgi:hypothetical protein
MLRFSGPFCFSPLPLLRLDLRVSCLFHSFVWCKKVGVSGVSCWLFTGVRQRTGVKKVKKPLFRHFWLGTANNCQTPVTLQFAQNIRVMPKTKPLECQIDSSWLRVFVAAEIAVQGLPKLIQSGPGSRRIWWKWRERRNGLVCARGSWTRELHLPRWLAAMTLPQPSSDSDGRRVSCPVSWTRRQAMHGSWRARRRS